MNKSLIIGIIVLLALIIILGLVYYFVLMPAKYSVPATTSSVNVNTMTNNQVVPTGTVKAKTVNVTIANFAFTPANISINAGDTVKWTNDDQVPHQIALLGFTSQVLNTGDSYSYTFANGGTFDYHCNIHPSMTGNVSVKP
jgi:plastocyanin